MANKLTATPFMLGRLVEHDNKSRAYTISRRDPPKTSIQHVTYGPTLNQKKVGACVGYAAAQALNTGPNKVVLEARKLPLRTDADALNYYHLATMNDAWPGVYPPNDTGTSGIAVAKALKKLKLIKGYQWAFNIEQVLSAIATGPLLVGVPWYEGMFYPDKNGLVKISGKLVGGHQIVITGFSIVSQTMSQNLFWARNSWGIGWGLRGGFSFTVKTLETLLSRDGDALKFIV